MVIEMKLNRKLIPTATHTISETNSSLHEKAHNEKNLISFFQEFSASIVNTFILAGILDTRLTFYHV